MLDTYFFRVLVIPTAVFLSAIFGASYGSGREVMEFVSSNGGTVLEDHFDIAVWIGSLLIFVLVVGLNYYGRRVVEQSMMLSVAALFAVLAVLVAQLFAGHLDQIAKQFEAIDHQPGGIMTGLKYAIVNGGYLPILLYCAMGLR